MSGTEKAGGHKGRHVKSSRALRYLFASGILRGRGSGKDRTVGYSKQRAGTLGSLRKRGVDVTKPLKAKKLSSTIKGQRHEFGRKQGLVRGGGKPDHSATRARRIAAGRTKASQVLGGGKGLALVKAAQLYQAGRTRQAAAAAQAAGISPRAIAGIGSRAKTTGRQADLRRAGFGEYGKSAIQRERESGRPITASSIRNNQRHAQALKAERTQAKALGKAMKDIKPTSGKQPARKIPSKTERDATREARIAAGRAVVDRQRLNSTVGPQNAKERRVAEHLYVRGVLERNVVNGVSGARRYSGRSNSKPHGISQEVWRKQWRSLSKKKRLHVSLSGDGNLT